jgi:hypothetical protein
MINVLLISRPDSETEVLVSIIFDGQSKGYMKLSKEQWEAFKFVLNGGIFLDEEMKITIRESPF